MVQVENAEGTSVDRTGHCIAACKTGVAIGLKDSGTTCCFLRLPDDHRSRRRLLEIVPNGQMFLVVGSLNRLARTVDQIPDPVRARWAVSVAGIPCLNIQ